MKVDAKEERFWFPKPIKFLTGDDKKLIIACIAEQLVKLVFGTHYYVWNGSIYHQKEGCPMGVESSCPVSRIVMDAWASEVKDIEAKTRELHRINPVQFEPLETFLISKYVDDVLTALEKMKRGVRWISQQNASYGQNRLKKRMSTNLRI